MLEPESKGGDAFGVADVHATAEPLADAGLIGLPLPVQDDQSEMFWCAGQPTASARR
jgi:hypothetical protein